MQLTVVDFCHVDVAAFRAGGGGWPAHHNVAFPTTTAPTGAVPRVECGHDGTCDRRVDVWAFLIRGYLPRWAGGALIRDMLRSGRALAWACLGNFGGRRALPPIVSAGSGLSSEARAAASSALFTADSSP